MVLFNAAYGSDELAVYLLILFYFNINSTLIFTVHLILAGVFSASEAQPSSNVGGTIQIFAVIVIVLVHPPRR